ncbi:DUF2304 domain-containing protein [Xylanimonas ulmi]|uniref:DUF2304 domain-containing protein n=1 Tax=Xylanimonas ulmi TaxID=228973 RepID=A0A4V2EXL6_9MICO|nr:DUF2304 domain-containing protein [Xylanibacterium ulmi]RZS59920.1 hypothetical protein EV386_0157 [Xylanibacterium ulmi]
MLIQFLLVTAILLLVVLLGRSTSNARHMAFRRLFLLVFAIASMVAIAFPNLLSRFAQLLGVGRGADLLLYALVVAFIGSLAMNSRRATELARMITLTTRRLAILEAETSTPLNAPGPARPDTDRPISPTPAPDEPGA